MKVSFDFDSTLSRSKVQKIASAHIVRGDDVIITTTRIEEYNNDDLYDVASLVGISRDKIFFTNAKDKYTFVADCDIHYDDDNYEVMLINKKTKCLGILVGYDEMI